MIESLLKCMALCAIFAVGLTACGSGNVKVEMKDSEEQQQEKSETTRDLQNIFAPPQQQPESGTQAGE